MHLLPVLRLAGHMLLVLAGALLLPMSLALAEGEVHWRAYLWCGTGTLAVGGWLLYWSRNAREIAEKDCFAAAVLCWLFATAAGALPYLFTGATAGVVDALFESMSGFTTTGASVITGKADVSRSLLLWRGMTQWLGGLGTLVLVVAVLPSLGIGGMEIYKREVPGLYSDNLAHRIRSTAWALSWVYALLTAAATVVLVVLGMSLFDAFNHALTTVSTGGFSTRDGSIGAFQSPAITWAVVLFMLLSGMNFTLHHRFLTRKGQRTAHFAHPEWRWYMIVAVLASLAFASYLALGRDETLVTAITNGVFTAVSFLTTTGYTTENYVAWGAFPQVLLLMGMLVGGCWGSTSGGVKLARVVLVFRYIGEEMLRLVHPKAVIRVKMGSTRVALDVVGSIQAYFFLYLISLAAVTLLISLDGNSFMTSLGAGVSALSNVGPGFGTVGPAGDYAHLSAYVKTVMIAAMLMGRLELMTVLLLLDPKAWRG
ncbi:MAG: TrkH family potassium uptake protein [SAR324 cluster bacterium]|nr:TrkH family potassium uptake protein [SAR324 cluster bacterium]MCZ6531837.1 TrkH family potassium uptake protein [SAR324 cluster bacterium]MCZ6628319.1 TrkH family potassium uptake protein [SAR324 cluster bacterium]